MWDKIRESKENNADLYALRDKSVEWKGAIHHDDYIDVDYAEKLLSFLSGLKILCILSLLIYVPVTLWRLLVFAIEANA